MKNVAFFDFDGTLTHSDSLKHFILWYFKWPELILKAIQFCPFFIYYQFLVRDNSKAKEKLFTLFWKDVDEGLFNKTCNEFAKEILPKLLNQEALNRFIWHIEKGDDVYVVSASIENYLIPFLKTWEVQLIATKLEVTNHKITGKFLGKNCYGSEKRNRIKKEINFTQYDKIYAYGDSSGDKEMLVLADFSYYKRW